MGHMVDGKWTTDWAFDAKKGGRFKRPPTRFRDRVTADGSSGFAAEAGRYHLYVSLACPWAHRALIMRALKQLEHAISLSVVAHFLGEDGWSFEPGPGVIADKIHGAEFLREVYLHAKPDYSGRVTVPVLWDRQTGTIVCNESREVMRMLNCEFAAEARSSADYCPDDMRASVDATLDAIYEPINNGVYRAGFARSQEAYDEAVGELFDALEHWNEVLGRQRYLCGDRLTEADICLFTTLLRFDLVYHTHFKCNVKRIVDYEHLWGHTREIYQLPGVADTCDFDHIRGHYYGSHKTLNPNGIIPPGPTLNWQAPHSRQ